MKLTLVKSDCLDDWYTIERAEHDGREWWEPNEYGESLRMSCRLGNAGVEGTSAEMKEIAKAIRERRRESFRRCAVVYHDNLETFQFYSPRNSNDDFGPDIPTEYADELAGMIEQQLIALPTSRG